MHAQLATILMALTCPEMEKRVDIGLGIWMGGNLQELDRSSIGI